MINLFLILYKFLLQFAANNPQRGVIITMNISDLLREAEIKAIEESEKMARASTNGIQGGVMKIDNFSENDLPVKNFLLPKSVHQPPSPFMPKSPMMPQPYPIHPPTMRQLAPVVPPESFLWWSAQLYQRMQMQSAYRQYMMNQVPPTGYPSNQSGANMGCYCKSCLERECYRKAMMRQQYSHVGKQMAKRFIHPAELMKYRNPRLPRDPENL